MSNGRRTTIITLRRSVAPNINDRAGVDLAGAVSLVGSWIAWVMDRSAAQAGVKLEGARFRS